MYVVETWLNDHVLDNELTISSYSLGGGGLLHIREDLIGVCVSVRGRVNGA